MKKALLATAAVVLLISGPSVPAFAQVSVVGVNPDNTTTPLTGYRWTLEEDLTYHVTPGVPDPDTLALRFHRSHMPVVATGDETTDPLALLDPASHYFLTVLPKGADTYSVGGAPIAPGQTAVSVFCNALPFPTAQISILVFEDDNPLNGAPDIPLTGAPAVAGTPERGLEGFKCFVEDAGGKYGISGGTQQQDAFGNPIGTSYVRNPDGSAVAGPIVDVIGDGYVLSGPDGQTRVKNLAPGKYGILCVPPVGEALDPGNPEDDFVANSVWQQTTTIEGKKVIDAWVKANEPAFFTEFGPPGVHVFVGFVRQFSNTDTVGQGTSPIAGRVTNLHTTRPPEVGFFSGPPVAHTTAWVALNAGALGQGGGLYAAPAADDGTFSIPAVPAGDYQLVIFDKYLDFIIAKLPITVAAGGGCNGNPDCTLGDVPVFQWFGRMEHWVFNDDGGGTPANAENGFWDVGEEASMPEQAVNIRWRDGTVNQSFPTDLTGFVPFDELFPFFAWQVAEIDFGRFKATGLTVTVDAGGGPLDELDPWSFGGQLIPQPQPENAGLPYRTEVGPVLTEAFQQFLGQTTVFQWGKAAYGPGENGGISGIVYYAITRAEDEPVWAAGEEWEPGIPGVTVHLYDETGTVLLQTATTDAWDESLPTGCVWDGPAYEFPPGTPHDCFDGLRNFNQARPGIFDGGYAFNDYYPGGCVDPPLCDPLLNGPPVPLAAGEYQVEVVAPPGYQHLAEESRNVDFGDSFFPSTISALLIGPQDCVGPLHLVPDYLEIFPDGLVPAHNAGMMTPLCSKKRVWLSNGQNAATDFWLYTQAPIAGHIYGFVLDDTANEFDTNSPQFGEKFAPPWLPISIQDWRGREIHRVYSDEFGVYNALVPSTYTANMPAPSGMSPAMHTACINSPGTFNELGVWVADEHFNPQYSQFCYTFQYMPGSTTYLDTPVVPVAAHAGPDASPLDCEYPALTPRIKQVVGGPWVSATGQTITIESEGLVSVPNPEYLGVGGATPKTITRDYGFGTGCTAAIGGVPLTSIACSNTSITGTVAAGTTTGDLVVTRSNGQSTVTGVTVTVGGPVPMRVPTDRATIQDAIDLAAAGDLILVEPGQYAELVIMWKPVRLQGYGPGATVINAVKAPTEKLQAWRDKIALLITLGAVDLLPGQEILLGGLEPEVFVTEEGPAVIVLAENTTVGAGGYGLSLVDGQPNARIDGLTMTGGDTGGAIFVNGFAHYLEISNNRITSNGGFYGGGIRVGHPFLVNAVTGDAYLEGQNDHITIHHNHIAQNGGLGGAGGGVSLHTGTDDYQVTDNYICGNYSAGEGGGIGHLGLSPGGVIARNTILYNENFDDLLAVSGGGIAIAGSTSLIIGEPSDGAGSVRIEANLIQGNAAQAGDGGGIVTARFNGQDVGASPNDPSGWHELTIVDNMIVNNVTGLAGGGIALTDTARVSIHHNTIANNDSTATAALAFTPGNPNFSDPKPAGIISREHSALLAGEFGGSAAIDPLREFSNPDLVDNIIWHNRSFYFDVDAGGPGVFGLVPLPADPPVYDDLAVLGTAAPESLSPFFCDLTDATGTDASNVSFDPLFVEEYLNGDRTQTIFLPEITSAFQVPPVFDEGGNFIRVRFGPLTPNIPATGVPYGDYHLQAGSLAIDAGTDLTAANPELADDFDGEARPAGASVDIGADERPALAILRTQLLPSGDQRKLRRRWRRQQRQQGRQAGGEQVLPLGVMIQRVGPAAGYETGADDGGGSKRLSKRAQRKKRREERSGRGRRNGRKGVK